jgi:hypothetical protein
MATIEGNEIALRKVAGELVPPVRSGQDARTDQDTFGSPFVTLDYRVSNQYGQYDPATASYLPPYTLAPRWVYGMVLEPSWAANNQSSQESNGQDTPRFFAAFGTAQQSNEVELKPGRVYRFPRGARQVFVRSNQSLPRDIRITWIVDRFATIDTSDVSGPTVTRNWLGDGEVDSFTLNNAVGGFTIPIDGYTHTSFYIQNGTNGPGTYDLQFQGGSLDSGNIPAGAERIISYGPGVGSLGGGGVFVGHGIVLPYGGLEMVFGFGAPVTGTVVYSWRCY